jgi:hypothetical protein
MSTVGPRSLACAGARRTRRALLIGATLAFVASWDVSAAEPPVTVEYQSAFAGYRHFDAQAPAVEWRQANDTIRDGTEGDAHKMQAPAEAAPVLGDEPKPSTPDGHQEHHK